MKSDLRTLLRNIQAAARIGQPDSVWAALDGLLDFPQISGNHPMDENFIRQLILPVGQALAHPLLNQDVLRPLFAHSHAGMRAIAGAALAERYLKGLHKNGLEVLNTLAQDPRQDVRDAVLLALGESGGQVTERQVSLFQIWLSDESPRLQGLAIMLLPSLPEEVILNQVRGLESDALLQEPEVRRALAKALSKLGQGAFASQALEILSAWAANPEGYDWVITRSLSRSWAADHPHESLAILTRLAEHGGEQKRILSGLAALQRHGADAEVGAALQAWQDSGSPQLEEAARKAHEKNKHSKEE